MVRNPLLALLLVALCGCSDPSRPDADGGDSGADGDADLDADFDGGGGDGDTAGGPPPVAPEVPPEPYEVREWMVATVPTSGDPYRRELLQGTFAMPDEGVDEHGTLWRPLAPGEGGVVAAGGAVGYAALRIEASEPVRLVARADFVDAVYANTTPQPGDPYGSRRARVPLVLPPGESVVVLHLYGARGMPQAELWSTPDELVFNFEDLTQPDLVVGQSGEAALGVAVLNLTDVAARGLVARVVGDERFEETEVVTPALAPRSVTQVAFLLRPRAAWAEADESVTARLHLESDDLAMAYEREVELTTVAPTAARRQTFLSADDGSVQYYGVLPPTDPEGAESFALVLSLHGAGVEAIGQARAYSQRDWAYVVAPTNRRPFGFDWEEWGHANAILALDDAMARLPIDPTRVYLTGHSMGGHGTWHVGVHHPGRFATIGPSAGWSSFYSYTGEPRPTGAFARARAHSDTLVYLENLGRRGVYVIHGDADDNVPVREGRDMAAAVAEVTDDLVYHEEPGAGHWWDGDAAPGADCVDWPPLFDFMEARRLDPFELDFSFRTESPRYSPRHSYVTLQSALTPYEDLIVESVRVDDSSVALTTTNVRSLEVDGAALVGLGVTTLEVDGESHVLADGPLWIGPEEGKRATVSGPFDQVFGRPFCYVYGEGDRPAADYASYAVSYWSLYGNGHACGLPLSAVDEAVAAERNLVYLGLPEGALPDLGVDVGWADREVRVGSRSYSDAALLFVFPEGEHLSAAMVYPEGMARLLHSIVPFSSRAGLPDYLVWTDGRGLASGFFAPDWGPDPEG